MGEIPREQEKLDPENLENKTPETSEKSIEDQIEEIESSAKALLKEGKTKEFLELIEKTQELRKKKVEELKRQREELIPRIEQAKKETEVAKKKFDKMVKDELGKWGIK